MPNTSSRVPQEGTLLATKLYMPLPRARLVRRPRLVERLDEALRAECKLTLISAPAGYGKTTLVSEWVSTLTPSPCEASHSGARGSPSGRGERTHSPTRVVLP